MVPRETAPAKVPRPARTAHPASRAFVASRRGRPRTSAGGLGDAAGGEHEHEVRRLAGEREVVDHHPG